MAPEAERSSQASVLAFREPIRTADERIQRILTALLLLAAAIVVAEWKSIGGGWLARRYDRMHEIVAAARDLPTPQADILVRRMSRGRFDSRDEAQSYFLELRSSRLKSTMVDIPLIGASVDINDLGVVAGLGFVGLAILLTFAFWQAYEIHYLALQRVLREHVLEGRSDPESTANAAYHELLAAQIILSPPSLARWEQSQAKQRFLEMLVALPVLIQGWLTYNTMQSLAVVRAYGAASEVTPQFLLLLLLGMITATTIVYYRAALSRWTTTFFSINQQLRVVEQSRYWNSRQFKAIARTPFGRRLASQFIGRLQLEEPVFSDNFVAEATIQLKSVKITGREIAEMTHLLEAIANDTASRRFERYCLISGDVMSSVVRGSKWVVRAEFRVSNESAEHQSPVESPAA